MRNYDTWLPACAERWADDAPLDRPADLSHRPHLPELYRRLTSTLSTAADGYEIVFVDDKGSDDSLEWLRKCRDQDDRVALIEMPENVGQHRAVLAGMQWSSGELVVVMDADSAGSSGSDSAPGYGPGDRRRSCLCETRGEAPVPGPAPDGTALQTVSATPCRQQSADGHRDVFRGITTSRPGCRRAVCRCALCSTASGSDRRRHERNRSRQGIAARQSLCLYRTAPPYPRGGGDPSSHCVESGEEADASERACEESILIAAIGSPSRASKTSQSAQAGRASPGGSRARSPWPFRSIPRACQ